MNRNPIAIAIGGLALLAVGALGYWLGGHQAPTPSTTSPAASRVLYWYDPMKPEVHFDKPGKSPFMDMQLLPKYSAGSQTEPGVQVSSAVQQTLGVRIGEVTTADFGSEVRAVARVVVDDRRIVEVQTRAPGYLQNLRVRSQGQQVRAGERIADVYSPEVLAAVREYAALKRLEGDAVTPSLVAAARARLRLLGLSDALIGSVAAGTGSAPTYGVAAPISGVVTNVGVRQGGRVDAGQSIITLADLSHVWLVAEVPERQLPGVHIGDAVEASFDAYPGEPRRGVVEFIYPDLSPDTRTGRVRIGLDNRDGRLKLGMFATTILRSMARPAIAVPSEAVIVTGRRTVVIIKTATGFRPVAVTIGREASGQTEILAGLQPGDKVVLSGQFLIDSEASLTGVLDRLDGSAAGR